MELLNVFFTSLGSFVVLFILTKIMGNREISQLSLFDYINGITIGSIAAEMATSLEDDFLKPLTAMLIYAFFVILLAFISLKSIKLRRIINGKSLILLNNGKLYEKNLKKAKMDTNEFLVQCRNKGFFNIADIQTAILESNGRISILPISAQRFVTPNDLNIAPPQEKPVTNVIMDGEIMERELKFTGNDEKWLKKQLHAQGVSKIEDVFLATCDTDGKLSVYVKLKEKLDCDIFE